MRVDADLGGAARSADDIATRASEAEGDGCDGIWAEEAAHDPFLPLAIAARATSKLRLGTGIAVAFARNPMTLAQMANDLHLYSGGRFMLGLGTQIRPHIERRFSMEWSKPASRLREMVLAIRAIWASWSEGTRLRFEGEFYSHTLMTPFFNPGPNPHGTPPIFVAAVGPRMTEIAAEVGDGLMLHGLTTELYVRQITQPALERGLAEAKKLRSAFQVFGSIFVVTGETEEEMSAARREAAEGIAFYASTPTYRPVLEVHGWGDLQSELHALTREGRWDQMGSLIDDDVLGTFAIVGAPDEIAGKLAARCGETYDRVNPYIPAVSSALRRKIYGQLQTVSSP